MTLKCIAGIETPDEGRIVLDDEVLFDKKSGINLSPQKRKVGYLFQNYALFPHMTVKQNIEAGLAASRTILPSSGVSIPAIHFKVILFPQPEEPKNPTIPSSISKSTASSKSFNFFLM